MNIDRRTFLRGLTAAAFINAALPAASHAQRDESAGMSGRIDVHQHFVPDRYRRAAEAAGHSRPDGMPALPRWSRQLALDVMDRLEIAAAVLSISSPGVHFADGAAAQSLTRAVNEEGAECVANHPKRFGMFASLPLPDVERSLRELEFSLDVLEADGVVLLTNYHGIYLGDARFEPLFSELNRRGTLAFIHPTSPYCPACDRASSVPSYPAPMLEFIFETTRAVTHLILSGTLTRYQNLRVIVPHAGAALPTLSDRIAGMLPALAQQPGATVMPTGEQVLAVLRNVYYDLAGYAVPKMLDALLRTTGIDHLLYGSDWPFTPEPVAAHLGQQLAGVERFDDSMRAQLARGNALNLLPRLRAALR